MRRTIAILALVGATGLLAGGCGSSSSGGGGTSTSTTTVAAGTTATVPAKPLSKLVYSRRMKAIGSGLTNSIGSVQANTAAQAAASLVKLQADLRAAQRQLASMRPPADVIVPHRHLVAAVGEFADELDPIIVKLHAGNIAALQSVKTIPALQKIATATGAIAAAGYTISG